ncbi:serine/arginine repetitive matrix-like protein [Rhynchospora pubera]|uniref:Serine/arginine repetitive matrix-like protein n=1 Tax=Rhynchospora pubera TaxID=906938 RepID=A0AAV8CSW2_9POAL|nr:serine/arginine repetitive matrix-like protein [Rhynchospora pubera]
MASAVASPSSPLPHPWMSPRISFSRDSTDVASDVGPTTATTTTTTTSISSPPIPSLPAAPSSPSADKEFIEFEFPLDDDPAKMLSADQLFSNGKLLPLRPHRASVDSCGEIRPPEAIKPRPSPAIALESDPYVFSPKAPSCSSRWRELLGLKKAQNSPNKSDLSQRNPSSLSKTSTTHSNPVPSTSARSLKYFIHRNTRSDSALSLPLLHRDSDADSVSMSARLSLSSSSSSERNDTDLPRLSLDSEKIPPRVRQIRARLEAARAGRSPVRRANNNAVLVPPVRGASVDSPRMNSSGKIVFQGLERSSSSPGSFNGGPRPVRPRNGMERSYSANVVRVSPVLNVPVCSLRGSSKSGSVFGFGQLFSPQKKDRDSSVTGSGSGRPGSTLARTGSRVVKVEKVVSSGSRD